jgi:hypothetical protein
MEPASNPDALKLIKAIQSKNYSLIAEFANNHTFSEELLDHIIRTQDMTILNLLIERIDVINKSDYFFQAGNYSAEMALELFKHYKDDFAQNKDMLEYDNYSHEVSSQFDMFFIEASKLDRFYQPLHYQNNKETFAALLLNNFLNCDRCNENMFPYLDYLLDNRKELNIKDSDIVQLLCERKYDYEDYTQNHQVQGQLISLIHYLLDKGISFESDTQGYLIQISFFNELDYQLLRPLIFNGSSGEGFLARYHDKKNWLTDSEKDELCDADYNGDRTYSLYKKFDSLMHEFDNQKLLDCQKIQKEFNMTKLNTKLDKELPLQPHQLSVNKVKI